MDVKNISRRFNVFRLISQRLLIINDVFYVQGETTYFLLIHYGRNTFHMIFAHFFLIEPEKLYGFMFLFSFPSLIVDCLFQYSIHACFMFHHVQYSGLKRYCLTFMPFCDLVKSLCQKGKCVNIRELLRCNTCHCQIIAWFAEITVCIFCQRLYYFSLISPFAIPRIKDYHLQLHKIFC